MWEPPRRGFEPRRFRPRIRMSPKALCLGPEPSPPGARPKISAASMDATSSPVRAQRPFEPFVAILRADRPEQVGRKGHKRVECAIGAVSGVHRRRGAEVWEPPRRGLEPKRLRPRSRTNPRASYLALELSPPGARPWTSAASMDATFRPVHAQRPFEPFVAIFRADRPEQVGRKRRKGSNPLSGPCVASIDAAGPRCVSRRGGG